MLIAAAGAGALLMIYVERLGRCWREGSPAKTFVSEGAPAGDRLAAGCAAVRIACSPRNETQDAEPDEEKRSGRGRKHWRDGCNAEDTRGSTNWRAGMSFPPGSRP